MPLLTSLRTSLNTRGAISVLMPPFAMCRFRNSAVRGSTRGIRSPATRNIASWQARGVQNTVSVAAAGAEVPTMALPNRPRVKVTVRHLCCCDYRRESTPTTLAKPHHYVCTRMAYCAKMSIYMHMSSGGFERRSIPRMASTQPIYSAQVRFPRGCEEMMSRRWTLLYQGMC